MADQRLRDRFPAWSWALDHHELGPILAQADAESWDEGRLQNAIMTTEWWKQNGDTARNYTTLYYLDNATFGQRINVLYNQIQELSEQYGLNWSHEDIMEEAKAALYYGRTEDEIRRSMFYGGKGSFTGPSPAFLPIQQLFADYGLPLSDQLRDDYARGLAGGRLTMETIKARVQSWAIDMFPHLKQQIEGGQTVRELAEPYRQSIARILELSPDSIDMVNDPRWRQALEYIDEKGQHRMMTQTEIMRFARQQEEWKHTQNYRDQSSGLGETLLRTFGQVA